MANGPPADAAAPAPRPEIGGVGRLAERRRGVVSSFDEHAGLGELVEATSGRVLCFHCVAIADNSRTIAVGTPVEFVILPTSIGRFEAGAVTGQGAAGHLPS